MRLQNLPPEILYNIFNFLDYESLHSFFELNSIMLKITAHSVLRNYHTFITNYNSTDFNDTSSEYITNIAKIIENETKNSSSSCSFCRHSAKKYSNLYLTSQIGDLIIPPNTFTIYLIYPGQDLQRRSTFIRIIRDFVAILLTGSDSILRCIDKVNIYIDYDESLLNQNNCNKHELTANVIDLTLLRQLNELERVTFNSRILQDNLTIFSVVTYGEVHKQVGVSQRLIHGLVETGIPFNVSMLQFLKLSHLSLPHHVFGDPDILLGKSLEKTYLPPNISSLNLSFSQSLTFNILRDCLLPLHLEYLNLSGNEIGEYHSTIKFPNSIRYLNLSNNRIRCLKNIVFPNQLISLDLSENYLTTDGVTYEFPKTLVNLNLSYNHISLVDTIKFPHTLLRLSLSANFLQDSLDLNGSPLIFFPESIIYLDISLNKFTNVEGIQFPSRLLELDISDNEVKQLNSKDDTFPDTLVMLNLSGNPFQSLDFFLHKMGETELIIKLPRLRALFLNNIDLTKLKSPGDRWCFPESVQYLHLVNTGIQNEVRCGKNLRILNC